MIASAYGGNTDFCTGGTHLKICFTDEGQRGLTSLRRKMAAYQANGARLGWLLIPDEQAVEIWPASDGSEPQRLEQATSLTAGPLFPGLLIDLEEIWTV